MATLSMVLKGGNALSQLKEQSPSGYTGSLGQPVQSPDIVFNPKQRIDNQMKTAAQVMSYASSKEMAEQGRTDMRGNVIGYSETLG